jgi:hypothetical protein
MQHVLRVQCFFGIETMVKPAYHVMAKRTKESTIELKSDLRSLRKDVSCLEQEMRDRRVSKEQMLLSQAGKRLDTIVSEYVFGDERELYTTLYDLDSTGIQRDMSHEQLCRWELVRAFIVSKGCKLMVVKKGQRLVKHLCLQVAHCSDAEQHAVSQQQLLQYTEICLHNDSVRVVASLVDLLRTFAGTDNPLVAHVSVADILAAATTY